MTIGQWETLIAATALVAVAVDQFVVLLVRPAMRRARLRVRPGMGQR